MQVNNHSASCNPAQPASHHVEKLFRIQENFPACVRGIEVITISDIITDFDSTDRICDTMPGDLLQRRRS